MYSVFFYGILCFVIYTDCKIRKYDVQFEAQKLYGQDLKSVLERFRRTPDYINILNAEIEKLNKMQEAIAAQYFAYYSKKLKYKIIETITENITNPNTLRHKTTPGEYYTKYIGPLRKPIVRKHTHNMSGVEKLEQYWKLSPSLDLDTRRTMVDLGFEYSGYVIHGLIKAMTPFGNSMSTMQPLDIDERYTTHSSHKISSPNGAESEDKQQSPDNIFRNNK